MVDVLYALHDFEAENQDELSFNVGEAIVVLERDDQYGDGWYQVSFALLSHLRRSFSVVLLSPSLPQSLSCTSGIGILTIVCDT